MLDKMFIRGLKIPTHIGVTSAERQNPQIICLDIEFTLDITQAAATDDLAHTIDYFAMSQKIFHYVSHTSFQLIETLADKVANFILQEFSLPWLSLTLIKKPHDMSDVESVGIHLERKSVL